MKDFNIDVEVHNNTLYIADDTSSGVKVHDIQSAEDVAKQIIEYIHNYISSPQYKYYVEITHCENISEFIIQSKWFDTYEQAKKWFDNDIDFLGENYDVYIMYAKWDETSDSYGDIETLEQIYKRND